MTRTLAVLALLAGLLAEPAHAIFLDLAASDLGGNAVDFEVLDGGVLAIDPDFATATPMRLVLVLEAGDATPLVWNALVDNLTGELWSAFDVAAEGAALGIGSAVANAGSVAGIDATASAARIRLDPGEPAGLDLGAVFGAGTDWNLVPGAGASIALRLAPIAVPEPASLALLCLGVAMLVARRQS